MKNVQISGFKNMLGQMLWNFLELEKNGRCHKSLDSLFKPHIRVSTQDHKMIYIQLPVESLKYQLQIISCCDALDKKNHILLSLILVQKLILIQIVEN